MFFKFFPLVIAIVEAKPLYVATPMLGQAFSGLNLHHLAQSSGLIGQPLELIYKLGGFEQLGTLPKTLLASHLGGQKAGGSPLPLAQHPTSLAFATPLSYPLAMGLKEVAAEKTIAGALVKQVPKLSKLPISISYSPKSLEVGEQLAGLGGGLSAAPLLAGKSFVNDLGFSFEY